MATKSLDIAGMLVGKPKGKITHREWNEGLGVRRLEGKINLVGEGLITPERAIEIGDYLMCMSEQMVDFSQPAKRAKISLTGRQWVSNLGYITIYGSILREAEHQKLIRVRFSSWPNGQNLNPKKAREIGAYLLDFGLQRKAEASS